MNKRNLISSLLVFLAPIYLFGQSVVGVVTDNEGKPLDGANVVVEGTDKGGVTDNSGKYTIDVGASGQYGVTASFIGYSPLTSQVEVNDIVGTVNFILEVDVVTLSALEVLASRADEKTYHFEVEKLGHLSFVGIEGEEAEVDKFCNNDVCEIV